MNRVAIEFKSFTFKYRSQTEPTLHDINLIVHRGEKIVIVGPSGSGKSTLLRCMNRLETISEGTLTVNYVSVADKKTDKPTGSDSAIAITAQVIKLPKGAANKRAKLLVAIAR